MKTLDLFIFADALGWRLTQEHAFLEDLLPTRNSCETIFGYSSSCDPTILTGATPQEHQHFSCFVKAPNKSPFEAFRHFGWIPEILTRNHRIRSRLSRYVARNLNCTGYFQLYSVPFKKLPYLDYTERKDIYEPGGIIGGQQPIFHHWEVSGKKWLRSDWRNGDEQNIQEVKEAVSKGETELAYLFTGKLDAIMHEHGISGIDVKQGFDQFANHLREIYHRARKKYSQVYLHVFSDHGMAQTTKESDIMLRWEALGGTYGKEYVAVWDSTMARFWFDSDSFREKAIQWLKEQSEGDIVTTSQLEEWNCQFEDAKYGELFYLLKPGAIIAPSFMNTGWVSGMHGYTPSHPDSAACWLTNHPTRRARRLQDIFGIMKEAAFNASPSVTPVAQPVGT